jgi:hypothetical protein
MYLMPQSGSVALAAYPLSPRRRFSSSPARRVRRLSLGTIDPAIQSQFFPRVTSTAGSKQVDLTNWQNAVNSGFLPDYYKKTPGDCGSPTSGKVSIPTIASSIVGGVLLKFGGAAGPAAPFVLAAGAALEVLGDVFGIFTGHHAAAVAKEQTELCQYIPAVNSALQAVDSGVSGGFLTSAQAKQSLDNIQSSFQQSVSNITKSCNAACVYYRMLEGIVAQRKENLVANPAPADAGPVSAATAGVTSAVASAAASTGLPSWLFYAAGGLLIWKLL